MFAFAFNFFLHAFLCGLNFYNHHANTNWLIICEEKKAENRIRNDKNKNRKSVVRHTVRRIASLMIYHICRQNSSELVGIAMSGWCRCCISNCTKKTKQKVKKIILKWANKGPQRPGDVKPFGRGTWQKKTRQNCIRSTRI